jgi:hypothetical protein
MEKSRNRKDRKGTAKCAKESLLRDELRFALVVPRPTEFQLCSSRHRLDSEYPLANFARDFAVFAVTGFFIANVPIQLQQQRLRSARNPFVF